MGTIQTIPARDGKAARLAAGQRIRIMNTHGEQVVDTWAFCSDDTAEYMAMDATRAFNLRMSPKVGDFLVTNRRRKILLLEEDTSPGNHDTLMAACDRWRYHLLGVEGYHDNCADNLASGLSALGVAASHTPSPLNLFMNIPWTMEGGLSFDPPVSRAGDYVVLRAEIDCVVAMSACPQDILPINGTSGIPTEAHFEVY
ncbi:MAG: urea carboxylase-associated family protein [Albidovulum sp.]|nr:urea carboxylase-associated family protein [Albidovulum sp.]MDE0531756.1 urea carboxylase-associated family protein [Albidovulum sp.]